MKTITMTYDEYRNDILEAHYDGKKDTIQFILELIKNKKPLYEAITDDDFDNSDFTNLLQEIKKLKESQKEITE